MFSGIVEAVGSIIAVSDSTDGRRLTIKTPHVLPELTLGESVSVSGSCLTVVDFAQADSWFSVEATHETLRKTKLGELTLGQSINLERALRVSDRLGGHLVTGHIDTVAKVVDIKQEGFSKLITFGLDSVWSPYLIEKGSVTIDGVSLTVIDCEAVSSGSRDSGSSDCFQFRVALIPYTMEVTTLGRLRQGESVNLETDVMARYVAHLLSPHIAKLLIKREGALSCI